MAEQDDKRTADSINESETRRNEILSERLELQRQLSKFESDISSKLNKRIQLEATILDNTNATKDIEKQILKNKQSQALIESRINMVADDKTKTAALLISQIKKQIDSTTDLGKQELLYNNLKQLNNVEGAHQLSLLNDQLQTLKEEDTLYTEILNKSKKLDNGLFSIVGNLANAIPGLGKFSQTFKDAAADSRKAGGGIAGMVAGFEKITTLAPLAIFSALVAASFKADKQVTSLAKGLSISKDEASSIRYYFNESKNSLTAQYSTLEAMLDAQSQLSDLSKFNILYSQETIDNQIILTKEIGLTGDESAKLNKAFILNNDEGNKGRLIVENQVLALAKQTGQLANTKKILQDVSKVSGQILLNFMGDTSALANAVLQADRLGINLEEARNISNSLLDFESSISNELEASVFLGRRFNLERARSLALQKDYVGATSEVLKQVGSIEEFQGMSAIHQQVIAKAAGMTVDQLSDSLMYQKFLGIESKKNLDRLLEAGKKDIVLRAARGELAVEELDKNIRALDAQDKFNIALDKAKEIFTGLVDGGTLNDLASILKSIVDSLSELTGSKAGAVTKNATNESIDIQKQLLTATGDQQKKLTNQLIEQRNKLQEVIEAEPGAIRKSVFTLFGLINPFGVKDFYNRQEEASKKAQEAVSSIDTSLSKAGALPQPEISYGDDIKSPGYGKRTLLLNKGSIKTAIKLNDNDNITATTNSNNNIDLSPITDAISALSITVSNLINRQQPTPQFALHVDGKQLGTVVGKQIETGTAMNMFTGYLPA
jgi:hypothetical protein